MDKSGKKSNETWNGPIYQRFDWFSWRALFFSLPTCFKHFHRYIISRWRSKALYEAFVSHFYGLSVNRMWSKCIKKLQFQRNGAHRHTHDRTKEMERRKRKPPCSQTLHFNAFTVFTYLMVSSRFHDFIPTWKTYTKQEKKSTQPVVATQPYKTNHPKSVRRHAIRLFFLSFIWIHQMVWLKALLESTPKCMHSNIAEKKKKMRRTHTLRQDMV